MALADNLIAAWELDEASGNAIDSHGSNDLTDNNTVGSGTGLVYGTARDFEDGSTEYFQATSNSDLLLGDIDFTYEVWLKFESKTADRPLVTKDDSGGNNSGAYLRYLSGSDRLRWETYGAAGYTSGTTVSADNFGSPSTGAWAQVIVWHDAAGNEIGIAVNAGTANTAAHSAGVRDTGALFWIGAHVYGAYMDGLMGPVRFWKRVLTSAERTELYNAGAGRTYAYITGAGSGYTLTADAGTYTLSGQAATLRVARTLAAASGTYSLTGQTATLRTGRTLVAGAGTFTLSGQAATLTAARKLTADAGAYTLTGQAATLKAARTLAASAGAYTLTGQNVGLVYSGADKVLTAEPGTYTLDGYAAGLRAARVLTAAAGSYSLSGQNATLTYSGAEDTTVVTHSGTYQRPAKTGTYERPARTAVYRRLT